MRFAAFLSIVVVALLLVSSIGAEWNAGFLFADAAATSAAGAAAPTDTVTYYGRLRIPGPYLSHPDSQRSVNQQQPGSILLVNGQHRIQVPTARDGAFAVHQLPYGTYLLQAEYHDFVFPTIRVEVMYREAGGQQGREPLIRTSANDFPVRQLEGSGMEESSPALIPVSGVHQYYIPREQMRITDLLKNPMIIMLLISASLMGMMKLFPEEEVRESQKMSREWQKKLANMATGDREKAVTQK